MVDQKFFLKMLTLLKSNKNICQPTNAIIYTSKINFKVQKLYII